MISHIGGRLLQADAHRGLAFVEDYFVLSYMPDVSPSTRAQRYYSAGIKWLHQTLGHRPLLREITVDNLRATMRCMQKGNVGKAWRTRCVNGLLDMARHAYAAGMLAEKPPTLKGVKCIDMRPPEGSLQAFYESTYLPAAVKPGRGFERQHRIAIRWLGSILDRHAMPTDLSEENLELVRLAVIESGLSEKYADKLLTRLRAVWRSASEAGLVEGMPPKRRPIRAGKPVKPKVVKAKAEPLPPPDAGTLRHFFETVYRPQKLLGGSSSVLEQVRLVLRRMWKFFGRDILIAEMSDELAAEYLDWLLRVEGLKPVSINNHRAYWFAIWRFAYKKRLIAKLPEVDKLKEELDSPDAWSLEEVAKILEATSCMAKRRIGGVPGDKFFRAFLLVAWWSGLRRGSLLRIKREHIDLDKGVLTVPGSQMKNRRGKRYKLGADAIEAVKAIWQPERELLFAWPYRNKTFYTYIAKIITTSGVAPSSRTHMHRLHKLRRTVATQTAVNAGMETACALLGHSSTEVTKRYIDPSQLPGNDATTYLPTIGGPTT